MKELRKKKKYPSYVHVKEIDSLCVHLLLPAIGTANATSNTYLLFTIATCIVLLYNANQDSSQTSAVHDSKDYNFERQSKFNIQIYIISISAFVVSNLPSVFDSKLTSYFYALLFLSSTFACVFIDCPVMKRDKTVVLWKNLYL